MKKNRLILSISIGITLLALSGCGSSNDLSSANLSADDNNTVAQKKVILGEKLFRDKNLSLSRTISCATCHDLEQATIDSRADAMVGAGLKDENFSRSDRNAPTIGYALFSPNFQYHNDKEVHIGGQLHDGRATDLQAQVKVFFLKSAPIETYIERIRENDDTINEFKDIYGDEIFENYELAFEAISDSIATFEKSDIFAPFDSKYDYFLAGEESLTTLEEEGRKLFEGKCSSCHPGKSYDGSKIVFTNYKYYNLGVPVNHPLRAVNGKGEGVVDNGLGAILDDAQFDGEFKVATLRNIAVSSPYMHNGLFKELKTVVHFHNSRDVEGSINPETNTTWEIGEVEWNKNTDKIGNLGLSDAQENAIVAFLKTLTDSKFEHLIPTN